MKKFIVMILGVFLLQPFFSGHVLALSSKKGSDPSGKSQRDVIEKTPWVDPTECPGGSTSAKNPALEGKVYIIGDSITANTQFVQNKLTPLLKQKGFTNVVYNSLSSRRLSTILDMNATGATNPLDGIDVLKSDKDWRDANTIIIELGTNGGVSKENIKVMMDEIKKNNSKARVFWVNVGSNNAQRPGNPIDTASIANILNENANLGYKVIDWESVVNQHPEYISDLGVHPFTTDGGEAFAGTIANGVSNVVPNSNAIGGSCECSVSIGEGSTSLTGANNEEKIWNFLISAGFTPAQTAGILGNMFFENAAHEPRRVQYGTVNSRGEISVAGQSSSLDDRPADGGYGLVQWTPGTKILPYAESKNKSPGDLGFQLELLVGQLKGDPSTSIPAKAAGDDLLKQTTPENAARSFMTQFERPFDQSEAKQSLRAEKAREIFDRLGGVKATPSGGCESGASGSAAKIVAVAEREFAGGAKESDDSYKKYAEEDRGWVTGDGWCDFFVSWVLNDAGAPFTGGRGNNAPGHVITPVPSIAAYFKNKNSFHPARSGYVPQPGDVVIFDYKQDERLDHVSIVINLDGEKLTTIGGNEDDKVSKNTYNSYNDKDIYGFGTQ